MTYLHVLEWGFCQFFSRRLAILFRVAAASIPSSLSTEVRNGEKCWCCWRHASSYIFFFSRSASWRQSSSVFAEWDLTTVFTTRMTLTLSIPFYQRSQISRSFFCSVASSCFVDGVVLDLFGSDFPLFAAKTANMRGLSCTRFGIKSLPSRSATPSQISLWPSMVVLPLLQSRSW